VYDDDCSVGVFGSLACGPAAVDVSTLPLSLAYSGQKQSPTLAYGSALPVGECRRQLGRHLRSRAARRETALPGLALVGFAEKALPAGFSVNGRIEFQYSPHALISGEKFGLGGVGSVRGYAERELAGDKGYLLRFEAAPAALELTDGWRLRPYLFLDHGRVMNPTTCPAATPPRPGAPDRRPASAPA
jgi:hypothetical protein